MTLTFRKNVRRDDKQWVLSKFSRGSIVISLLFILNLVCVLNLAAQDNAAREIQAHYKRAMEALKAGQPDAAAKEFHEILLLDPKSAEAYANLGVLSFNKGQYAEAARSFEAALKLKASLWDAQAFLGLSRSRLGETHTALPLLEGSFKHLQNMSLRTRVGMELIRIHQDTNTLDGAVDTLRALRESNPDDPQLLYTTYRMYSDLAAQAVATLLKTAPNSAVMHLVIAQAYLSQDDFPGAIAEDRKALEIDPQLPGIHYELGRAVLANSRDEAGRQEAQKEFETELSANPNDAYCEYELGEIDWLRSDQQLALRHFSHALQLRPNLVDAQIGLGKVLMAMGKPDEALPPLREAIRLEPENDVAHYRLAQIYRKLGRTQDADREMAAFRKLRDAQAANSITQRQVGPRSITNQTIESQ